ncbi:GIY-YIG nuclease family protein [Bacteroidales bacterium AH-315-N07]|nr:GIY-YIG nuclease family protein [Bacteroidales bacterium AH-315-N07]
MYYVYILQSKKNGKFYIGSTPDIMKRLAKHNEGKVKSTAHYIPYELIYFEGYKDKMDALQREKKLKHHGQGFRRLKERLQNSVLQ